MFSHLRSAVESIAVPPHSSTDSAVNGQNNSASAQPSSPDNSLSPTSSLSSSQLADSALSTLRKSFATSRSSPPISRSSSMPATTTEKPRQKLKLEERLRASLSAADVATSNSPTSTDPRTAASDETPPSPDSTPLPASPLVQPSDAQDSTHTGSLESVPGPIDTSPPTTKEENEKNAADEELVSTETPVELEELTSSAANTGEVHVAANDQTDVPKEELPQLSGSDHDVRDHEGSSGPVESTEGQGKKQEEETSNPSEPPTVGPEDKPDLETLQRQLKQVEQRFSDVSLSFKRLQAEKLAADAVLRELTPLESIRDAIALKEYLESVNSKTEVFQAEIKRLNEKLEVQEDNIEKLRQTRELSASQVNQIDSLQAQLRETDALFHEAHKNAANLEDTIAQRDKEISSIQNERERLSTVVKEEEEKRTKAISLLKSVRQKLVKAERDKEDALKEIVILREKDRAGGEQMHEERQRFEREIDSVQAEKEKSLCNLRSQFEKDITSLKERHEKDMAAMRSQLELDAITTKSAHSKEVASKNSHISTLEASLNSVTRDKNTFFEQLQLRQAETESAQSHLEIIQHQNVELQYQLREANDRVNMLKEDLSDLHREHELRTREPTASAENIAHLITSTESKYEAKVAELKRIHVALEKERNEIEAEWSRKLKDRGAEIDELKRLLGNSTKSQEKEEEIVAELKAQLDYKDNEAQGLQRQLADLTDTCSHLENSKALAQNAANDLQAKIIALEKQLDDNKAKDTQLRQTNKLLREELKKVQSSVALLERQRNPGVGYWTTRTSESSPSDGSTTTPAPAKPRTSSPTSESSNTKDEEDVNLEYLRNVILQFLEHKEMRPNLVRVLSIILHFTPQETRRLMAKV